MDNRLNDYTGDTNEEPTGLPLSDTGAERTAAAVGDLAAAIQNNMPLTSADLQDFTVKLEAATEVVVGGRTYSLEQLRSDQELMKNIPIWQEILSGNHGRHTELTLLIPAVVDALEHYKGTILQLSSIASLDPETAAALARFGGGWLWLAGLTALELETAAALARFGGRYLLLDGLTSLDPDTAAALAQFSGNDLSLDGLTSLDPETAAALAQFEGRISCYPDVKAQIDRYKSSSS